MILFHFAEVSFVEIAQCLSAFTIVALDFNVGQFVDGRMILLFVVSVIQDDRTSEQVYTGILNCNVSDESYPDLF